MVLPDKVNPNLLLLGCAVGNVSDYRSKDHKFNPAPVNNFMEIDHEIISTAIIIPSTDSIRVVVSYKRKYVHEVLVNCLVELAHVKSVVR